MKYLYLVLLFILTSCVEIIDDIKLNLDGSGTFKYTVNLSQSKVNVNSILALDSIDGKKVMKLPEIKEKVSKFKTLLSKQKGITNVIISENYTDFIIKIQCDFESVDDLENAIKVALETKDDKSWVNYSDNKFSKGVPEYSMDFLNQLDNTNVEKLKLGSYTSIFRFDKPINEYSNKLSVKSKSGLALMTKTTPDKLLENPKILDNTVSVK